MHVCAQVVVVVVAVQRNKVHIPQPMFVHTSFNTVGAQNVISSEKSLSLWPCLCYRAPYFGQFWQWPKWGKGKN